MNEFFKIITIWILAMISVFIIAESIGKAWKYSDENEAKVLQHCVERVGSYQECYSGLNYYNYWDNKKDN